MSNDQITTSPSPSRGARASVTFHVLIGVISLLSALVLAALVAPVLAPSVESSEPHPIGSTQWHQAQLEADDQRMERFESDFLLAFGVGFPLLFLIGSRLARRGWPRRVDADGLVVLKLLGSRRLAWKDLQQTERVRRRLGVQVDEVTYVHFSDGRALLSKLLHRNHDELTRAIESGRRAQVC